MFLFSLMPWHRPSIHERVKLRAGYSNRQSVGEEREHGVSSMLASSRSVTLSSPSTNTNCLGLKSSNVSEPSGECAR